MNDHHILESLIYADTIKEKQVEKLYVLNECLSKQFTTLNNTVSIIYNKEAHDKVK